MSEFNQIKELLLQKLNDDDHKGNREEIEMIDEGLLKDVLLMEPYVNLKWLEDENNLEKLVDWYFDLLFGECEHDESEEYDDEDDVYNGQGDYLYSRPYHVKLCKKCGFYIDAEGNRIYND